MRLATGEALWRDLVTEILNLNSALTMSRILGVILSRKPATVNRLRALSDSEATLSSSTRLQEDEEFLRELKRECPALSHTFTETTDPFSLVESVEDHAEEYPHEPYAPECRE